MNNPSLFIENASRFDVANGFHLDPKSRPTLLIQITDIDNQQVTPKLKHQFAQIEQFWFEDTEDLFDIDCITPIDANKIAMLLQKAKDFRWNVVVQCEVGLCRSGAIVECGEHIGFVAVEKLRIPNVLVRRMVLQRLFIDKE